ncbi:type II toxin-antitoxin system RelE/ParE family toxin [Desulfonatronospira sp.]|uniref:type II toxin-antitoxin system RelE family toxin n=1 Tax=Desulfonatronospira sp. TaxID=1962951 RepID=UPI0025C382D6|nr:type II toxin-antitoxin system RelE/ParE family toxin [Desulfonatronospira sp.]
MAWKISFTPRAKKELKKLGRQESQRVIRYLKERVAQDPRALGTVLKGQLREFCRYRVGDYPVLARIQDKKLLVLVVHIGHRSIVYQHPP